MPNWVINQVSIKGSAETIKKIADRIINAYEYNGETREFSFQTILPRPKSLDIFSSSDINLGVKYLEADEQKRKEMRETYGDGRTDEFVELAKAALDNEKKYGSRDWYDWSIRHWGTKWDADVLSTSVGETSISLVFNTAWATPLPVIEELSRLYPDVTIDVSYADEDLGYNCGEYGFEDGQMYLDEIRDFEFACEMWGYDPEEVEEYYGLDEKEEEETE